MFYRPSVKTVVGEGQVFTPSPSALRLLVGGDVNFDYEQKGRYLGVYIRRSQLTLADKIKQRLKKYHKKLVRKFAPRRAQLLGLADRELLINTPANAKIGVPLDVVKPAGFQVQTDKMSEKLIFDYPFRKITSLFQQNDLVLINLETPLAEQSVRTLGSFKSKPEFAHAMRQAGISLVNVANNHMYDAGQLGFIRTMEHLGQAGIAIVGGGENRSEARRGKEIDVKGKRLAFLGYTQYCNSRFISVVDEYSGILPLDANMVVEDIQAAKQHADLVFVNLHWGVEDQPFVQLKCRKMAHRFIDAGADGIIGHHPHVPHAIEVYKKRPILYSLGNFIFGTYTKDWVDNILAQIIIGEREIEGVIVHPIAGKGSELFQPFLLTGARAQVVLDDLRKKCAVFNTALAIDNELGFIQM